MYYGVGVTSSTVAGGSRLLLDEKDSKMYKVGFRPVSSNYYPKFNNKGGGCSTSYLLSIYKDGKHFIDSGEYLEILSPNNTWHQNTQIRENNSRPVYDPDTKLDAAVHTYGKAKHLLDALNAFEEAQNA